MVEIPGKSCVCFILLFCLTLCSLCMLKVANKVNGDAYESVLTASLSWACARFLESLAGKRNIGGEKSGVPGQSASVRVRERMRTSLGWRRHIQKGQTFLMT